MLVRCGQCTTCRIRRKQAWVGRLRLEHLEHKSSRFLTLTYRDDNRPEYLVLDHLRDFMKRYRYHYGPCRFFAIGEYGKKSEGAHWHLIIFGHEPIPAARYNPKGAPWKDNKAWDYGFSFDGNVTAKSIGYVSGYTLKGATLTRDKQPLCRQSLKPGIGFKAVERLAKECVKGGLEQWPISFSVHGRNYPLAYGALAHFQTTYLESGGSPPVTSDPEMLDALARAALADLGTRIRQTRLAQLRSYREVVDLHGLPRDKDAQQKLRKK